MFTFKGKIKSVDKRGGRRLIPAAVFILLALLGASREAAGISLGRKNVHPGIFSPNGDGFNDVVVFEIENPSLSEVSGKIYDMAGREIADLKPGGPTPDSLYWDGRDSSGNTVPAGIYIYRIDGNGQVLDGAVAVVK